MLLKFDFDNSCWLHQFFLLPLGHTCLLCNSMGTCGNRKRSTVKSSEAAEVSCIIPHFALQSSKREVKSPCFSKVWQALNTMCHEVLWIKTWILLPSTLCHIKYHTMSHEELWVINSINIYTTHQQVLVSFIKGCILC